MASLKDYGIRFIWHGAWSDPEIEWKKSKYQTLVFNYWDVSECTDYETLDRTDDNDLQELVAQLWDLTPQRYARPQIDYEWEVSHGGFYPDFDDNDYYAEHHLSEEEDFVLHNASQALRQALRHLDEHNDRNADIKIFRNECGKKTLVANYSYQGSTLKDYLY